MEIFIRVGAIVPNDLVIEELITSYPQKDIIIFCFCIY
ncbi:hypothetical protein wTpre_535 [Wolbachia endosymbiont of Trichogramma pretiosum]|nr:hypothetical protein wTpre_535 [Wolbachia endosymbiont of Trichogramma pretiosum]